MVQLSRSYKMSGKLYCIFALASTLGDLQTMIRIIRLQCCLTENQCTSVSIEGDGGMGLRKKEILDDFRLLRLE